jgi:hypothetical protein
MKLAKTVRLLVVLLVWWVLWLHEPSDGQSWTRFAVYQTEKDCEAGRQRFIALDRTTERASRCGRERFDVPDKLVPFN